MLIKRVLTALILIPLVLLAIFCLSNSDFSIAVGLLLSLAVYEYAGLIDLQPNWQKALYLVFIWLVFIGANWLPPMIILWVGLLWWLLALFLLLRYPKVSVPCRFNIVVRGAIGLAIFIPCWQALVVLHALGSYYVLLLMLIVWASDTGAYFVGRAIGRRKLAAQISPNKTIAGLVGGVIAALIVVIVSTLFLKLNIIAWLMWIILAVVTSLFSVFGDLFESMLKRFAEVKDSGNILPGHGGVFDRIDGLLAAAPVFAIGVVLIGLFG